jgi:hypothetical protein
MRPYIGRVGEPFLVSLAFQCRSAGEGGLACGSVVTLTPGPSPAAAGEGRFLGRHLFRFTGGGRFSVVTSGPAPVRGDSLVAH